VICVTLDDGVFTVVMEAAHCTVTMDPWDTVVQEVESRSKWEFLEPAGSDSFPTPRRVEGRDTLDEGQAGRVGLAGRHPV